MSNNSIIKLLQKTPNHWYVITSAWISKIIAISAQLLSIKMIIEVLGENKYAAFVLLSALLNWIVLIEMGIGSSLQNAISARRAKKENYSDLIATALLALIPIFLFWILLFIVISQPFEKFYFEEYKSIAQASNGKLTIIAALLFSGIAFGSVINRIWYAEQAGWKANILVAIGWLLGLLLIYFLNTYLRFNGIASVLIGLYFPQGLIGWSCFLYFLIQSLSKEKKFSKYNLLHLSKNSIWFWLFSIACAISLQSDYIIMSQNIKAQEIIQYSIVAKVFSIAGFVFNAILVALWPICAESAVRSEWQKLNYYRKKYIAIGILFVFTYTILFILFRDIIITILAPKKSISLSISMITLFGTYQIIRIWCDTYGVLLLSLNMIKIAFCAYAIQAVLSVLLQWYGSLLFGYRGMIIGLTGSLLLSTFWCIPLILSNHIKNRQLK